MLETPPRSLILVLLLDALLVGVGVAGVIRTTYKGTIPAITRGVFIDAPNNTAESARLQVGDRITAMEGVGVDHEVALDYLLDRYAIGETARLTIERNGTEHVVTLPVVAATRTAMIVVNVLVAGVFFLLGLFVALRRPNDPVALIFHGAMNAAALMVAATNGSNGPLPTLLGDVVNVLYTTAYALLPALFIHFARRFPLSLGSSILWVSYTLALLFALLLAATYLLGVSGRPSALWLERFALCFDLCRYWFILGTVLGLLSFAHSYRTTRDDVVRRQLRWVMFGAAIGPCFFITLLLSPKILQLPPLVPDEIAILLTIITPISFSIAIVRHRLLDIDRVIERSALYGLMTLLLALAYIGAVSAATGWLRSADVGNAESIPAIVGAAAVAILFEPLRSRLRRVIDRRFYRVRYNYRQAHRNLLTSIAATHTVEQAASALLTGLDAILLVERASLAVVDGERLTLLATHEAVGTAPTDIQSLQEFAPVLVEKLGPEETITIGTREAIEPGAHLHRCSASLFNDAGVVLAHLATIDRAGERYLLLCCGAKRSGTGWTVEDVDLVISTTAQTTATVSGILLQRELSRVELAAEKLRDLNETRSFFFSTLSHEMRTPLTSIRLFAELLARRADSQEKVREYADVIDVESERLAKMIDNALDLAQIEKGMKRYRPVATDLSTLVDEAARRMERQVAAAAGAIRTLHHTPWVPLSADEEAVIGAVVNLIGNAVKYSSGPPEITLTTARTKAVVSVTVEDKGIGMDAQHCLRVFEPFVQLEHTERGRMPGVGLGLAIVRHAVEAHAGEIEINSVLGEGSTVTLTFPLPLNATNSSDRG